MASRQAEPEEHSDGPDDGPSMSGAPSSTVGGATGSTVAASTQASSPPEEPHSSSAEPSPAEPSPAEPSPAEPSSGMETSASLAANASAPPRRRRRFFLKAGGAILVILALLGAGRWLLGLHTVRADSEALELPLGPLRYIELDRLLRDVVQDGRVDYVTLRARESELRRIAATLERTGPTATPERFPSDGDVLAWYINAYNVFTLLGVLHHWPIESVHDVRGKIEPRAGFGFFWAQRFVIGGKTENLYDFENELRERGDARIHAAINCASASCPDLAAHSFEADRIDTQLDNVTRQWVG
ncbi:MAG: DUF547 domain-containing protein, partial [Myxococcota bacterium]